MINGMSGCALIARNPTSVHDAHRLSEATRPEGGDVEREFVGGNEMQGLAHERRLDQSASLPQCAFDLRARDGVIARPELKISGGHDLGLHAAHIAGDRDRILIFGRGVEQMVAPQPEACDLITPNC